VSIYAYQLLKVMGLSEQRLLRVLDNFQVRSLDPDHVICRQGVRLNAFSHVLSGLVGAGVPCQDGSITPIHILGPGTRFGVDAVLNPEALALETV
jgi:CRP-like cAMP-binding protein